MSAKIAEHINLFHEPQGIRVCAFYFYDEKTRTTVPADEFVIPWHELHGIIDRLERIERHAIEDKIQGNDR